MQFNRAEQHQKRSNLQDVYYLFTSICSLKKQIFQKIPSLSKNLLSTIEQSQQKLINYCRRYLITIHKTAADQFTKRFNDTRDSIETLQLKKLSVQQFLSNQLDSENITGLNSNIKNLMIQPLNDNIKGLTNVLDEIAIQRETMLASAYDVNIDILHQYALYHPYQEEEENNDFWQYDDEDQQSQQESQKQLRNIDKSISQDDILRAKRAEIDR